MGTLHLVVGNDDLLVHRAVGDLVDELTTADDLLTVDVHDAVELEHLPSLRTTSLLGDRTGVAIRGLESGKVRKGLRDEIVAFLDDPDDEAVLVLASTSKNKVRAITTRMKQHGTITEVEAPKPWDDSGWDRLAADEFTRHDVSVDRDAVAALRRHAGTETPAIASQVAQVVAAADGPITADFVDDVLGGHGRESSFAVVDAVVDRDVEAALVALRGLQEAGEHPMLLFGALAARFRQLLAVRAHLNPDDYGSWDRIKEVVKPVGASPGQINHLIRPAHSNFGPGELAWCQDRIAQLDVDLKGGSALDEDIVIELAVIDLATPRKVGADLNPLATTPVS